MNTTQLECFMAVADFLNFSRAAERLRLTQPAVSHQIKTLEDELGAPLFRRTSKSVRLTREGQLFLQYAGEILKLSGAARLQVRRSQAGQMTRLAIGCRSAADLMLIGPALERMRRQAPQVLPILRLVPMSALDNLLAEGEVQMLFTFSDTAPPGSVYRELVRCPVVCVCRADHPLAACESLTMDQLKAGGRVAAARPPACPAALFALQGQIVTAVSPDQVLFCETQEVLLAMVAAGYAFAVMMDFPQLRSPGLRYIPIEGCAPLSFGAAWRSGTRDAALRRFVTLLEETLSPADPPPAG